MPEKPIDWNELFFEDPAKAMGLWTQGLRQEYRKEVAQDNFWRQFYGAHPELKADAAIVCDVLSKNYADMQKMEVEVAIEKLAELAHEHIAAETHRRARQAEYSVIRGFPGSNGNEVAVPPEGDGTLAGAIKHNRERRRKAQAHFQENFRSTRAVAS